MSVDAAVEHTPPTRVSTGERLDRLPLSRFHWKILALIGAGMFLDAFDIYIGAGVLGALIHDGWSTLGLNAWFVSATFAGMTVGAWSAGVLGDRFGRRFTYQINLAIFGLASLAAAFAPNMFVLIGLRFLIGVGLGAEIVVGYATLSEFVPAASRGRWIAILAIITNTALFASSLIGLWVIPNFGWQYMFAMVGVAALIVWALRKSMPESPRWLEQQGRYEEADRLLTIIEDECGSPHPDATTSAHGAAVAPHGPSGSVFDVFSSTMLRRTLIGCLIHIVVGFSLYGFISWLPTFFVKSGFSVAASLQYTTLMSLGGPAGAFVGWLFADSAGRKATIVGSALAAAAFGLAYPHMDNGWSLTLVGFGLVTSAYALLTSGFALYVPELFPTRYRMRGAGVCATVGRITTAIAQYAVVSVYTVGGLTGVLSMLVGLLVILAIVVLLFGSETKGSSLEEINEATLAP